MHVVKHKYKVIPVPSSAFSRPDVDSVSVRGLGRVPLDQVRVMKPADAEELARIEGKLGELGAPKDGELRATADNLNHERTALLARAYASAPAVTAREALQLGKAVAHA